MSDTLYLSLWYPNLRLEALPDKLTAVLGAFAAHGGEARVYAATVWPVSWSETPVFQRVYGRMAPAAPGVEAPGAEPRQAVEEALELLHDDYAYEFQIGWSLWEWKMRMENAGPSTRAPDGALAQDDNLSERPMRVGRWVREPRLVRVTGYGPLFDEGAYEQDGHIRIDFGIGHAISRRRRRSGPGGRAARGRECAPAGGADGGGREGLGRDGAPVVERAGREPGAAAGGAAGNEELSRALHDRANPDAGAGGGGVAAGGAGSVSGARPSGRTCCSRRDLPQRLGMEHHCRRPTASRYSHSLGAHSKFKIHASKEVQLKNNRVELHDVQIELYGEDGSRRPTRLRATSSNTTRRAASPSAQGPVEMTLTRPRGGAGGGGKKVEQLAA